MRKAKATTSAKKPAASVTAVALKHFENLSREQAQKIEILSHKLRTVESERDAWRRACLAQGEVIKVQADRILDYEIPW